MEELLKNWKKELKELKDYKKRLVAEYSKRPNGRTEKSFNLVCGKIETLEVCINLQKFEER